MSGFEQNQSPGVELPKSDSVSPGTGEEQKLREELARELARCQDLEASVTRQKAELEARGRVLFCLFNMSELMERPEATFQEILDGAVRLISCQGLFPHRASARIVLGDQNFLSDGFKEYSLHVSAPIETPHQKGFLEVFWEDPGSDGVKPLGLQEEQWLLEVIANRLRIALERKWSEQELKRLNNLYMTEHHHRKYLSRRLLDLMEGDRRQMAMELHDHIGQLLATMKIDVEMLTQKSMNFQIDPSELTDKIKKKIDMVLKEVKHMALGLRPQLLEDLGLVPALRAMFEEIQESTRISINFFWDDIPQRLSSDLELALFRVAQEATTNVVKHAQATEMHVNLTQRDGLIILSVEDNGQGFDPGQADQGGDQGKPLGIMLMNERAIQLGGRFSLESRKGAGTLVMVELPFSDVNPGHAGKRVEI